MAQEREAACEAANELATEQAGKADAAAATIAAKERPDDAAKYRVVRHDGGVVTQCRAQGLEKASCAVHGGDGIA